MQKIKVRIKNVFGVKRIYPVCAEGLAYVKRTGMKTLRPIDIKWFKANGYEVVQEQVTL